MRSGVLLSKNGVLWVRPGHIRPDRAFWTTIGPHGATGREQTAGTWVVCATSATPQGPRGGCGSLRGTVGVPQVPKTRNGPVSAISLNGTEPPSKSGIPRRCWHFIQKSKRPLHRLERSKTHYENWTYCRGRVLTGGEIANGAFAARSAGTSAPPCNNA